MHKYFALGFLSVCAISSAFAQLTISSGTTYSTSGNEQIADTTDVNIEATGALLLNNNTETINSLSGAGNVSLGSGRLIIGGNQNTGNQNTTYGGRIGGTGGLTLALDGMLTLTGIQTYNGATILNSGTLRLGASNLISDNSRIIFGGGRIDLNGFNERMGALSLSADSSIAFTSGSSAVRFANSSAQTWNSGSILTVHNWNGNQTGGGSDQLIFMGASGLTSGQVSQIKFFNPAGLGAGVYDAALLAGGEVVPVPEPATIALGSLLLGAMGLHHRKRKNAKKA
jgi:fibronectin-binding autotransporter adhesin